MIQPLSVSIKSKGAITKVGVLVHGLQVNQPGCGCSCTLAQHPAALVWLNHHSGCSFPGKTNGHAQRGTLEAWGNPILHVKQVKLRQFEKCSHVGFQMDFYSGLTQLMRTCSQNHWEVPKDLQSLRLSFVRDANPIDKATKMTLDSDLFLKEN